MSNLAREMTGHILTRNDQRTTSIETIMEALKQAYLSDQITEGQYVTTLQWFDKTTRDG